MIRIFIPTHNRYNTTNFTTAHLLEHDKVPYTLIVDSVREKQEYKELDLKYATVLVQHGHGVDQAREYARTLMVKGEWCLQLDDNIESFHAMHHDRYMITDVGEKPTRAKWGKWFNQELNFRDWYSRVVLDSIEMAQTVKSHIVTFSPFDNPFFRQRKWRDVGYTMNKAVLLQKTNLRWNQSNGHPAMEEYALCAAMHLEYGRVLINNFAYPHCRHYGPGGLGPYEQRLPAKVLACQDLMTRYPGFFRISKKKAGGGRGGEINVRFHSLKQIELWRDEVNVRNLELKRTTNYPNKYERRMK